MRKIGKPAPVMQAPEAAGSGDTETVKTKVAKHELLNAGGEVVEDEEGASGIRYTMVANGQAFDWQHGQSPDVDRMLACFGAKTLCTNESSAIRNNPKGAGTPDECMDAIRERFALLTTGKWVDRTREGVGAKVDLDAFANAVCNVLVTEGKYTEADVTGGKLAATRAKLDDDKAWLAKARKHPPFAAEYARLRGTTTASTDDFAI